MRESLPARLSHVGQRNPTKPYTSLHFFGYAPRDRRKNAEKNAVFDDSPAFSRFSLAIVRKVPPCGLFRRAVFRGKTRSCRNLSQFVSRKAFFAESRSFPPPYSYRMLLYEYSCWLSVFPDWTKLEPYSSSSTTCGDLSIRSFGHCKGGLGRLSLAACCSGCHFGSRPDRARGDGVGRLPILVC